MGNRAGAGVRGQGFCGKVCGKGLCRRGALHTGTGAGDDRYRGDVPFGEDCRADRCALNRDQLEEIYLLIDDSAFERISRRAGIDIFEDEEPDFGLEDGILSYHSEKENHPAEMDQEAFAELARRVGIDAPRHQEPPSPPRDKPGFFTLLAAALTGVSLADRARSQERRCNGDCANCPPHYGYRHGRWYYGKGHQYGCEFGGNKGDGSLD